MVLNGFRNEGDRGRLLFAGDVAAQYVGVVRLGLIEVANADVVVSNVRIDVVAKDYVCLVWGSQVSLPQNLAALFLGLLVEGALGLGDAFKLYGLFVGLPDVSDR